MSTKRRPIEVDAETAELLEARAVARGMTVSELLADIAANQQALPAELARHRALGEGAWSPEVLEEDARRLHEFERARSGAPWEDVKAWMESWGSPNERPIPKPRET